MLQVGLVMTTMMTIVMTVLMMMMMLLFNIRMLLKSGADSNLEMEDGRTPIHIAAEVTVIFVF